MLRFTLFAAIVSFALPVGAAAPTPRDSPGYDLLSDETQRREWHQRYGLPWAGKNPEPSKAKSEEPHEDLNWACAACHGVTMYRCAICNVGICAHFTVMLKLQGFTPRPVCVDCKKDWNDEKHSHWKLMQMMKRKMGRVGL